MTETKSSPRRLISPSLLSADFTQLAQQIQLVEKAGATRLHLDVMDGHFVPNITFGPFIVAAIRKAAGSHLDVHLMIEQPHRYLQQFVEAGADTVIVHAEASDDLSRDLEAIRDLGAQAGVALNPDTPFAQIEPYLDAIDYVLIMSVFPGFGGQNFIDSALINMVHAVQARSHSSYLVAVDGGVNLTTVEQVFDTGVDMAIVGSGLFGADDIPGRLKELQG